jgi:hypothetical protein
MPANIKANFDKIFEVRKQLLRDDLKFSFATHPFEYASILNCFATPQEGQKLTIDNLTKSVLSKNLNDLY